MSFGTNLDPAATYDQDGVSISAKLRALANYFLHRFGGTLGVAGATFTSADASTAAAITAAPTSGQKIVLTEAVITTGASALTVDLQEETSATIFLRVYLPVNGVFHYIPAAKVKLATADKKFMVKTSGAGNVAVTPYWRSEA